MQPARRSPLLTSTEIEQLFNARESGSATLECSLDLHLSTSIVEIGPFDWAWEGRRFPYPERYKDRTIYFWTDGAFEPAARFSSSLIKLVPTEWGAPTFEIDGIKMLPSLKISPFEDARIKVALIRPRGKVILDTCGGLGYFGAWCSRGGARLIQSYEVNSGVLWLRGINPWSPVPGAPVTLIQDDVTCAIVTLAAASMDAVLHDPPRFGIAGELYSLSFYAQLARVLKRRGSLFHYTGSPNKLTTGRDLPGEVTKRLRSVGFATEKIGDGILAVKK